MVDEAMVDNAPPAVPVSISDVLQTVEEEAASTAGLLSIVVVVVVVVPFNNWM